MICQNLVVEGTDEISAEILDIIDLSHFQQDILHHVDVGLQHLGLYHGSWESLTSERCVWRSRADLIYDKADNVICFFVSIVSVLCQPVAKISLADIVFYDFRVILNFFCVILVIQLFNSRNVES